MKKSFVLAFCAAVMMSVSSCAQKVGEPQPEGITDAQIDSVSYAIGQQFGLQIAMSDFGELNLTQMTKALKDVLSMDKDSLRAKSNDIQQASYAVFDEFMSKRVEVISKKNIEEGEAFLEKNKSAEGVKVTESGLQYRIVRSGNGNFPTADAIVKVNYEGSHLDGSVFDSSYEREEPVSIPLGQVIPGWAEGMQLIDEGGEIEMWIPSELAYGINGAGSSIGPSETLKFKVELVSIEELPELE